MLVNCPECGASISDQADPCPKCGFPDAGHRSKEACEEALQRIVDSGLTTDAGCTIEDPSKAGCQCTAKGKGTVTKAEARRSPRDAGYDAYFWVECPSCGKLIEKWLP
jgi:peptide subunit release factor 1 (eRF1)